MTNSNTEQLKKISVFKALHESDCFLLPNPWDVGTSIFLQQVGYKALATTSAGFAFSQGLPDDVSSLSLDLMLAHIRDVVSATKLPVNADFQTGFADDPETVGVNVTRCVETGIAGLSIEDGTGVAANPLYDRELAIERIKAARVAIDKTQTQAVLTGRCEAWLVGAADPFRTAMDRLTAYADSGADCLYAPGVSDPNEIAAIVKAVAPKPVNVLVSRPNPELSLTRLTDLGVRRISVGSAFARVAWGAFMRAATDMISTGEFNSLSEVAAFAELNDMFSKRAGD